MNTRREILAGATVAGLAMAAPPAWAAGNDAGVLTVLVAYQQEVRLAYDLALRDAPLDRRARETLTQLRAQADQCAKALQKALAVRGGKPVPGRALASVKLAAGSDLRAFARNIIQIEETTVTGYYVALQTLVNGRRIRGTAAFMAQAGRRLVMLRDMAGDPLLPRAFETGR